MRLLKRVYNISKCNQHSLANLPQSGISGVGEQSFLPIETIARVQHPAALTPAYRGRQNSRSFQAIRNVVLQYLLEFGNRLIKFVSLSFN